MGKASRLKKERAAAAASNPYPDLAAAVELIGYAFGSHPDCAAVSAFIYLTGKELGYELTPRSVSVVAHQISTDEIAFMGPRASALVAKADAGRVEDHRTEGRDSGHMVVTAEDPTVLLDGNLGQLRAYGLRAPDSVILRIESTKPENGLWVAKLSDLQVTYLPDDNESLWERYAAGLEGHREEAIQLASMIRAGASVAQIKASITPMA